MGRPHDFVISHSKKIAVFILFVGAVFSLFTVSKTVTGLTTDLEQVEEGLESAQSSFNFVAQEREGCLDELDSARSSYNSCSTELGKSTTNLNLCNAAKEEAQKSYSACLQDKQATEIKLAAKSADYDELARNSVRGLCCSFSDFQSGAVRQWSISNNTIVCSGNFTVNCTSGNVTK